MAKCTFGSENVTKHAIFGAVFEVLMSKKLHTAVAKRTFGSENVKNCHSRALFEVLMSKNCTPLWREAHSEVKMLKN